MASVAPRALRSVMGYRKFADPHHRVVVFDSGYHVQAQLVAALQRMGHHVVTIPIGVMGASTTAAVLQTLIQTLLNHRPDFVLSVNQIGFDTQGAIGGLLDDLAIPVAVWYVDCPFLTHDGFLLAAPKMSSIFVWERRMVPLLQALGVERTQYLPLGCDSTIFNSAPRPHHGEGVGFVGNSMQTPIQKWQSRLRPHELHGARVMCEALLLKPRNFIEMLGRPRPAPDRRMTQLAWATYAATAAYRNTLLANLRTADLHVFGDPPWQDILPQAHCHQAIAYGAPLRRAYQTFAVNLNFTSLQMPTAVNQRVFDVPASGAFLLSDAQEDLHALFDADSVATFDGADALQDQVDYFTRHETHRQRLIARARAQITARHTYEHRMEHIIQTVASASDQG